MFLILDHLNTDVSGGYDKSCHRGALGGAEKCWLKWMDRMGLPLNRRYASEFCASITYAANLHSVGSPPSKLALLFRTKPNKSLTL